LEWCLDHAKFREQDYLRWAREYYSLPVIKTEFFEQPVPATLWQKTKNTPWRESCFPLLEWDGVLFVGCLEPPVHSPLPQVQFLLAPRSLQKIWWQELTKPASSIHDLPSLQHSNAAKTIFEEPEVTGDGAQDFELAFEIVEPEKPDLTGVHKIPELAKPAEPTVVPHAPAVSAKELPSLPDSPSVKETTLTTISSGLEGLTLGDAIPAVSPDSKTAIPAPEIKEDDNFEMPLGLSFSSNEVPQTTQSSKEFSLSLALDTPSETSVEVPLGLSLSGLNPQVSEQVKETKTEITGVTAITPPTMNVAVSLPPPAPLQPPAPPPAMAKPPMPPPMPAPAAVPPPPPVFAPTPPPMAPKPQMTPPPPPPPIFSKPAAATPPPAPIPMATPQATRAQMNPVVQEIFAQMSSDFEQCMVLTYANEKLVPWQWDNSWKLSFNAPPPIDTTHPSIFKIVLDTKGPYHGYIYPNPTNDAFFMAWNQSRYPDHITIVPMVVQNEVVGMVLGATSRVKGAMANLATYQNLAADLATRLGPKAAA
jgi:hypothetical protein